MFLQKNNIKLNSQRWEKKYKKFRSKLIEYRHVNFFFHLRNKSGRNHKGYICVRHRQTPRDNKITKHANIFYSRFFVILNFFSSNLYKNIAMEVRDRFGNVYFLKYILGLKLGSIVSQLTMKSYYGIYIGCKILAWLCDIGQLYCSIVYNNKKLSTSNGSYCSIFNINYKENSVLIILPSGLKKKINFNSTVIIGRMGLVEYKISNLGKAGSRIFLGTRPNVRGVAMNPVDHPHGGRTKTNSPERSPWGWVTKCNR